MGVEGAKRKSLILEKRKKNRTKAYGENSRLGASAEKGACLESVTRGFLTREERFTREGGKSQEKSQVMNQKSN